MGRMQIIVLSQPQGEDISNLENGIQRSIEAAPIRFIDALVLTKKESGAIEFTAVSDIENPDRAWRGLLAQAFFGSETAGIAPWSLPAPPVEPDEIVDLSETHLLDICDRIPRNSSGLLVLVEHLWMDEFSDDQIAPGRLVANAWVSYGFLVELGNALPQRGPI